MTYTAQIFDGHMDAGSEDIEARTMASAWKKAIKWARTGEWHTAGSVTLVVTDSRGKEERGLISVPKTCEAD